MVAPQPQPVMGHSAQKPVTLTPQQPGSFGVPGDLGNSQEADGDELQANVVQRKVVSY